MASGRLFLTLVKRAFEVGFWGVPCKPKSIFSRGLFLTEVKGFRGREVFPGNRIRLAQLQIDLFAPGCTHRGFQTSSLKSHRPRTLGSIHDLCTRLHNAFSVPIISSSR